MAADGAYHKGNNHCAQDACGREHILLLLVILVFAGAVAGGVACCVLLCMHGIEKLRLCGAEEALVPDGVAFESDEGRHARKH